MRKQIITGLVIIGLVLITHTALSNQSDKQLQQEAQAYKQCILEQSQTQGYIIRSACSSNYKRLDKIANLKYKQIKLEGGTNNARTSQLSTKTIQTWTKHRTRILSTTIQHSSNTQQKQNRRQQPKNNIQGNTKTRSKARRKIICTN